VRLVYQPRPDATLSFRHGWQTMQAQRLTGVDVTSQTFGGGPRNLVRRYHLAYDPSYHVSLLASVQMEGRCVDTTTGTEVAIGEDNSGNLPASTGCPTLPAMTFGYSHVAPFNLDGSQGTAGLTGYEGFDERMTTMAGSPPNLEGRTVTRLVGPGQPSGRGERHEDGRCARSRPPGRRDLPRRRPGADDPIGSFGTRY
jgi:hypothetical protein